MNWIWGIRKSVIKDNFLFLALATKWRLATQCSKEDGGGNRFGKKFKSSLSDMLYLRSLVLVRSWLYGSRT